MNQQHENVYEFGSFRIDTVKRLLLKDGETVSLTSKCFDTLLVLIEHHGQVVGKDKLMTMLWPDTIVEENNLTQQISLLRKSLGERAGEHRYIVTIPGRGYSFVADLHRPSPRAGEMDLIVEQHTRSSITVDVTDEYDNDIPQAEVKYLQAKLPAAHQRWSYKPIIISLSMVLIGVVALLALQLQPRHAPPPETSENKRSIAVLPFRSLNSDPTNDYLGSGMSDTLIAKLSNLREISVRPTSAVIKYAGRNQDAYAIGRDLGVDSVLEGTVQKSGDRIRVTVQLVNVREQSSLWAQTYDEEITDIFAVQDAISDQVAQAMLVRMNVDERKQIRRRDTESVEAYQEYLRGRFFWNKRTEEALQKSIEHFHQAINKDPNYAQAYAGLADSYNLLAYYKVKSVPTEEAFRKAEAAANKALSIDETLAEAHTSLALIRGNYNHDDAGAERAYKRAIELNPNYATAHHWYSEFLVAVGRTSEAMTEIVRAQELDPLSPVINTSLGERLYYARQYDEAITQLRRTLDIEPNFGPAHFALGLALEQKGRYEEAVAELRAANEIALNAGVVGSLGHTYAMMGQKSEARKILEELKNRREDVNPHDMLMIYVGLGDRRQAIDWLKKLKDKKGVLAMLKTDPRLDLFLADPKVQEML